MVDRVGEGGDAGEDSPLSRGGDQAPGGDEREGGGGGGATPPLLDPRSQGPVPPSPLPYRCRPLRCPTAALATPTVRTALSAATLSATLAAAAALRHLRRRHPLRPWPALPRPLPCCGSGRGQPLRWGRGAPLLPPTGIGWGAGDRTRAGRRCGRQHAHMSALPNIWKIREIQSRSSRSCVCSVGIAIRITIVSSCSEELLPVDNSCYHMASCPK